MVFNIKQKTFAKLFLATLTIIFLLVGCVNFACAAVIDDTTITDLKLNPNYYNLKDNKPSSYSSLNKISFTSNELIDSIYIIFWDKSPSFTLSCGDKNYEIENSFLHAFV